MKKLAFFLQLLLLATTVSATDLKQSVCIVRPDDAATDSLYKELGNVLFSEGFLNVGRSMRNQDKSFGSGFVYQAASGNRYVVTNRHVVYPNKSALLQFSSNEGAAEYKKCNVLYTNQTYDIALVEIPESGKQLPALKPYTGKIAEGESVHSAGYPGLGGNPLWQFGEGVISNTAVNSGDFGKKDSVFLLQHTAQIDRGNSGGPLLKKVGNDYLLVGINTYKASSRENTNFSIQVSDLNECIRLFEGDSQHTDSKDLKQDVDDFLKLIYNDCIEAAGYISTDMILHLPADKVRSLIKMSGEIPEVSRIIRSSDTEKFMTGLKALVAKEMSKAYSNPSLLTILSVNQEGDNGIAQLQYKKAVNQCNWALTDDGWQMSSTNSLKKSGTAGSKDYDSVDYGVFKTGWIIGEDVFVRTPINGNGSWGLSLSLIDVYFRNYGMWDFRFECFDFGNKKQGYDFAGGLSTNLGVLVPIKLKAVSIVPYIKAGPAFHGSEDDVALLVCGYGGLKLGYKFKNTRMTLLLDAHYAYRYMAAGSVQDNFNPHTIEAGIGFAY